MTHMLYADDLNLLAYMPGALKAMLNRLAVYGRSEHLTINTAESEGQVDSKSGAKVPTFNIAF